MNVFADSAVNRDNEIALPMQVIESCFTIWAKERRAAGEGKIAPLISKVRLFRARVTLMEKSGLQDFSAAGGLHGTIQSWF